MLIASAVSAAVAFVYTLHIAGRRQLQPLAVHVIAGAATIALYFTFTRPLLTQMSALAHVRYLRDHALH